MQSKPLIKRLGQEHGQILMLSAVLVAALLGFLGLVIDAGLFYSERRQAQNAADEASLAAANELAQLGSVADATTAALNNAAANGFDNDGISNTVTVNIPPISGERAGDSDYVEVNITEDVATFFIQVLIPDTDSIAARGVAGGLPIPNYAIFVGPGCGGDGDVEGELEGDNIFIDGAIYSANLEIDGDTLTVTESVTWLCNLEFSASNWTFGSGPTQLSAPPPVPVDANLLSYAYYQPFCTYSVVGDMQIDASTPQYWLNNDPMTGVLKPGVYCATGHIHIQDGGSGSVSGNVTFVSGDEIELHQDVITFNLTAFQDDVLAFSIGPEDGDDRGEIEFEAQNGTWIGMLLAPNGEIELEGDNLSSSSTIIFAGKEAEIEGDNISITAMELNKNNYALVE